jgi:uncharacterized protein (DUF362 family)/Pyruvate/2-oxoacid:ferredoxin oxidoreductase delta subunit
MKEFFMKEVSIVKCKSYDDAEKCVRRAIQLIGGIETIVKPNDKVLLKPNLLTPKPPSAAVTTHPKIVHALIEIIHSAEGEILIGDSSGGIGLTDKAFKESKIAEVAEKFGVEIVNFDKGEIATIKIPNGKVLTELRVAKSVLDSDVVVTLPKLKTHALTLYTGAIKNMFGTIPGGNKSLIHAITGSSYLFSEALIDIYSVMPVHLAVMDGIVGMEGLGPHMGKPKKSGVILAGKDCIALDAVASSVMGFSPSDIPMLKIAHKRGLGTIHLDEISVLGEMLEEVRINFKKPERIYKGLMFLPAAVRNAFVERPRLPFPNKKRCSDCRICQESCPASAIEIDQGPKFDYEKCILCYCCYELCPKGGIKLKKSLLPRTIYRNKSQG